MKPDITNICVAICIAVLGFYLGLSATHLIKLNFIGVCGVVISICALIVAYQALTTWKNQFKHHEQYKSLVNIEDEFRKYCEAEIEYWHCCLKLRRENGNNYESSESPELNNRNLMYQNYIHSWNELLIHLPSFKDKRPYYSPKNVQIMFRDLLKRLRSTSYQHENDLPDSEHENIISSGIGSFQVARRKLS